MPEALKSNKSPASVDKKIRRQRLQRVGLSFLRTYLPIKMIEILSCFNVSGTVVDYQTHQLEIHFWKRRKKLKLCYCIIQMQMSGQSGLNLIKG